MEGYLVKGTLFSPFTFTFSKPTSDIWAIVFYYFILNKEDFTQNAKLYIFTRFYFFERKRARAGEGQKEREEQAAR